MTFSSLFNQHVRFSKNCFHRSLYQSPRCTVSTNHQHMRNCSAEGSVSERKDSVKFVHFVLLICRDSLVLTLTSDIVLELEIQRSLSQFTVNQSLLFVVLTGTMTTFQYTKWLPVSFVDFKITLIFVSTWIASFSSAGTGCGHTLHVTMRVANSKSDYNSFTSHLRSYLSPLQCKILG